MLSLDTHRTSNWLSLSQVWSLFQEMTLTDAGRDGLESLSPAGARNVIERFSVSSYLIWFRRWPTLPQQHKEEIPAQSRRSKEIRRGSERRQSFTAGVIPQQDGVRLFLMTRFGGGSQAQLTVRSLLRDASAVNPNKAVCRSGWRRPLCSCVSSTYWDGFFSKTSQLQQQLVQRCLWQRLGVGGGVVLWR